MKSTIHIISLLSVALSLYLVALLTHWVKVTVNSTIESSKLVQWMCIENGTHTICLSSEQ